MTVEGEGEGSTRCSEDGEGLHFVRDRESYFINEGGDFEVFPSRIVGELNVGLVSVSCDNDVVVRLDRQGRPSSDKVVRRPTVHRHKVESKTQLDDL